MRTDIHRPSVIVPADYDYVGIEHMKSESVGDCALILEMRQIIKDHMTRTGGFYSRHEHGGNCHICGAGCIYTVLFYHAKTNSYIRTGNDCAQKLEMAFDANAFKKFVEGVKGALELHAGKRKTRALLADHRISDAWAIYLTPWPQHTDTCKAGGPTGCMLCDGPGHHDHPCTCDITERVRVFDQYEERTIRDIVSKVVRYGSISDKAAAFVASLLNKIAERPAILARRAAEAEAAAPAPRGRVIVTGHVLAIKSQERPTYHYGDDGVDTKVLIQALTGFKVWGNRFNNVEKGDLITFTATITPSNTDPKFAFFSRPAKAFFVREVTGELLETSAVQNQPQEAL